MTTEELIARLAAATGPDRELDREIAPFLGWVREKRGRDRREWWYRPSGGRAYTWYEDHCPQYTASIDAALTLVPEGWASASIQDGRGPIGYVHNNAMAFVGIAGRPNPAKVWHEVRHPVRAIALCIAALRARGDA
jgi:hypothetical protein